MTLIVTGYKTKKELKASVGEKLKYQETSMFGTEYTDNGEFSVAHRPAVTGEGGREFFARVTMRNGVIDKVT